MYMKMFTEEFMYEILGKNLYVLQYKNGAHMDFMKNYAAIKRMKQLSILLEI